MAAGRFRAALPADLFATRPIELSLSEHYKFWEALDAEGSADGHRDLAVDIGRAISVEHFAAPIFAALCSPNLSTAAQRLAIYKPLIGPVRIDVDTTDELTITYLGPAGETPPALLANTELVFWDRVGSHRLHENKSGRPESPCLRSRSNGWRSRTTSARESAKASATRSRLPAPMPSAPS